MFSFLGSISSIGSLIFTIWILLQTRNIKKAIEQTKIDISTNENIAFLTKIDNDITHLTSQLTKYRNQATQSLITQEMISSDKDRIFDFVHFLKTNNYQLSTTLDISVENIIKDIADAEEGFNQNTGIKSLEEISKYIYAQLETIESSVKKRLSELIKKNNNN